MKEDLINFLNLNINKKQLQEKLGEDLYNVDIESPVEVTTKDLIFVIRKYISNEITKDDLVNWVNVVWVTDLFEYNEKEEESISSVMDILETVDEEDVTIDENDFSKMITSLEHNRIYEKDN